MTCVCTCFAGKPYPFPLLPLLPCWISLTAENSRHLLLAVQFVYPAEVPKVNRSLAAAAAAAAAAEVAEAVGKAGHPPRY